MAASVAIQGICRAANSDIPGATVYLIPTSVFSGNPVANDPIPVSGAIATTTTDQNGAYAFYNQAGGAYWVAWTFDGFTAFDYHNTSSLGLGASGQIVLNTGSSFTGDLLDLQSNGVSKFSVYVDPTINQTAVASGNLIEILNNGGTQYQLVNRYGIASASGILVGVLNIIAPQNCAAINIQTVPLSGGRTEIRMNPQWGLFANGVESDFARGWAGWHDYNSPNPTGGVGGRDVCWIDSDQQFHIDSMTNNPIGGSHVLKLVNQVNPLFGPPQNGLNVGIEFDLSDTAYNTDIHGLVQVQTSLVTPHQQNAHMGFFTINGGALFEALRLAEFGDLQVLANGSGHITVANAPPHSSQWGLLSLGGGGFAGLGGSNFVGSGGGTAIAVNTATGFTGNLIHLQQGGVERYHMDTTGHSTITLIDTVNDGPGAYPLHLKHSPTVTPVPGIACGIDFNCYNGSNQDVVIGNLQCQLAGVTAGNEKSQFTFQCTSGGVIANAFRVLYTTDIQGYGAYYANSRPDLNANRGLMNLGDGTFASNDSAAGTGGATVFKGSGFGTVLAINPGAGFTGSLIDAQTSGATVFSVDYKGNTAIGGPVQGNATPYTRLRTVNNFGSDGNLTVPLSGYIGPIMEFTSAVSLTLTRNAVVPLITGASWTVFNNTSGAQSIQIIGTTGTGITIGSGKRARVYSDGINVVRESPDV